MHNLWLITTTITLFTANLRVIAEEFSVTAVIKAAKTQPSSYTALQVTDLNSDYWQTPHVVFSKFTYSDRCELFEKSLQRKPRHHKSGASSSGKVSCINDRSQTKVNGLYQMTVRYLICSCRKIPWMETEIHFVKKFDLHEYSLWLLTDRLIAILPICVRYHIWI